MIRSGYLLLLSLALGTLCSTSGKCQNATKGKAPNSSVEKGYKYYLGADFSYVNQMEDCGGKFRVKGVEKDPFQIFADKGSSIARFRIWHNAAWTKYSNLADVKKSIRRAKALKMRILLDFHYSDTWTDPARQNIPKAWENITDQAVLGDSLYNYAKSILLSLHSEGLLPELVQVGNEINAEILQKTEPPTFPIHWSRNVFLLNKGLSAVHDVSVLTGKPISTVLHIAQPENAEPWFSEAVKNGIGAFDWIGLSYYSQWSTFNLEQLAKEVTRLKTKYQKRIMIVETGYPNSLANVDQANNLLDTISQLPGYSISKTEQKRFMVDMTKKVIAAGCEGVIYWEPAWISTPCKTQWGTGSHWDNALFFDPANQNELLPVADFMDESQY
jgi:arabinogalactan endo-1,4-beta-galactosidase